MTTDDGLKGWREHVQTAYLELRAKNHTIPSEVLEEMRDILLSHRANVHDSGDGERYQHMRLHGVITGETSKDGCEWIYGDELDSQIDAAILAEKGEV